VIPNPLAELANDPVVIAMAEAQEAAGQRLQTLLMEQAAAQSKLNTLPATPATRPQRLKLRAVAIELGYEIEEAKTEVESKHRDVVKAQRAAAEKWGWQLSERAKESGGTHRSKITDLLCEFQELRADHEAGQTLRSIVIQSDRELGEETPAAPSVKFASGLGEGLWDVLLRLAEVQQEEHARRHRVSITGTVGAVSPSGVVNVE